MEISLEFTLGYVTAHTGEAAKVLQGLPVEQTSALLEEIPADTGARLLEKMSPAYAAQCLMVARTETMMELLQKIRIVSGVALLRLFPYALVPPLIKSLPAERKSAFKKRLSYPQDSAGAWMDSDCPTLQEGGTVGAARSSLRNSGKPIDHSLCVLKADGTVAGLLRLSKLVVARNKTDLARILTVDLKPVMDQASLQTIASYLNWENFDALAVTNRKGSYLGILSRTNLEKGLEFIQENYTPVNTDSIVLDVVKTYATTLSGLVQTIAGKSRQGTPND